MAQPKNWPNIGEIRQDLSDEYVKKKDRYINEFVIPIEDWHGNANFFNIDVAVRYDIEDAASVNAGEYAKKLAEDIREFLIKRKT